METSKIGVSRDRLSELPDSLVLNILSLLPMRDVVMTTLLSKRFKDLWITVPCLSFESDDNDTYDIDGQDDQYFCLVRYPNIRFQNFVNRALILWRGTKILKFEVVLFVHEWPPFSDLNVWLCLALENEVEKLNVNLLTDWDPGQYPEFTEYCPPQRLYSCSSIRELYLAGCELKINGNVQWDQLKYLKIVGISLSEHVMNQILSGSPQLEVLSLYHVQIYDENLNIHSSSLKALTIEKFILEVVYDRCVLTIWAPNVETLEILGDPFNKYVILNVSSLTNATADIYSLNNHDIFQFSGYKLLEEIMGQVYQTNRHVEKVTLSDWCIKVLREMKKQEKRMFEPLSNAKFLKLYGCGVDDLMGLLETFPNLTKLVLENRQSYWGIYQIRWGIHDPPVTKFDTDKSLESQTNFPKSCLLHLTIVEIEWVHYNDSVFPIIEFLLKNASKLEKLVVRATGSESFEPELWFPRAEKLLKIPRLSPTAEVILCRDDL